MNVSYFVLCYFVLILLDSVVMDLTLGSRTGTSDAAGLMSAPPASASALEAAARAVASALGSRPPCKQEKGLETVGNRKISSDYLNVGPGHAPTSKLGILLGGPGSKIHLGFNLALPWVERDLKLVKYVSSFMVYLIIEKDSYFVRVEHNVSIPMFIFPLLDYFLVDEIPLKFINQRLVRGRMILIGQSEARITCGTGQPCFRMYSHSFEIG